MFARQQDPIVAIATAPGRGAVGMVRVSGRGLMPLARALKVETTHEHDYIGPYVADLANVIDMTAIRNAGLKIGADPMGGAGIHYWAPIAERYGLDIEIVNRRVDPTFSFMTVDKDGKIRMDCSSHGAPPVRQ